MGQRLLEINHGNSQAIDGLSTLWEQVEANIDAERQLIQNYEKFNSERNNRNWSLRKLACLESCSNASVIPSITVLDAMPSNYDELTLRNHFQKFLIRNGFYPETIQLPPNQEFTTAENSNVVEIPIETNLEIAANEIDDFIRLIDNSIRPIMIQRLSISKNESSNKWSMDVSMVTYFQPKLQLEFAKVVLPSQETE